MHRRGRAMIYRRLGRTGTKVSELCLGTMTFGREVDETGAASLVRRFVEAGGNFIDTADVYQHGVSESFVGSAIKACGVPRDELVIATKVFGAMSDAAESSTGDWNNVGLSRKHVMTACDESLKRLGVDHIDLYQVHLWDAGTPLEETLSALDDLVHSGKVRYLGCSNFTAWQTIKALWVSDAHGFERFVCVQPQYSLVERNIEAELLPACRAEGLGILAWSPLGGGFLSGKYRRDEAPPEGSRIAGAPPEADESWDRRATDANWELLDVIAAIGEQTGHSPAQVALNWLLRQPGVVAPIIGARSLAQLDDNLGATDWALDSHQLERLSAASDPGAVYPARVIDLVTQHYGRA
jgi:aryl-alcohol dehydrogenase-like predicted oxidoreductase